MEAALRTAVETLEGKALEKLDFEEIRGKKGIKKATLKIAEKDINVAVVSGLENAKEIMEEIKSRKSRF